MAWTNAFDIGDCTLAVLDTANNLILDPSEYAGHGISISETNGVVTFSAFSPINQYIPLVVLGFDPAQADVRIADAQGAPGSGGYTLDWGDGRLLAGISPLISASYLTVPTDMPFTPNPLPFDPAVDTYDTIGLEVQESGGG